MKERCFAIGDIHGTYKALIQCLQKVNFDYEKDKLILLGDYTDGYPEVYECIEEILKIKNRVALKGNHEEWFNEFLTTEYHPANWGYGGKATLISYLKYAGKAGKYFASGNGYKSALVKGDIPDSHSEFFKQLLPYYVDGCSRCFVHGGFNRHLPFYSQRPTEYFWNRDLWEEALNRQVNGQVLLEDFFAHDQFREIFIGHSSTTKFGTDKPQKALNIYNLDTGAGHSGKLTIMDVETKEYWQSDPVSRLYLPKENRRHSL